MADQLSLRLEADQLPALPDLRPMLPRPLPEPFDSDDYLFEPWWGGERALVLIGPADVAGGGTVRVVDAAGVDRSDVLPELAGLAVRIADRAATRTASPASSGNAAERSTPAASTTRTAPLPATSAGPINTNARSPPHHGSKR